MRWLSEVWFRVRALFRRERFQRDLADEMAFHVEMETRKNLARGMGAGEARRQAHVSFGGVERMRERARSAWGVQWAQDFQDDARFALRQLLRRPGFATLAILTLGLGIGGTVALFSAVHGLLIRPMPFEDEERRFPSGANTIGAESSTTSSGRSPRPTKP